MNEEDYYSEEEAVIAYLSKEVERRDRAIKQKDAEIAELRQGIVNVHAALGAARDIVGERYLGESHE